MYDTKVIDLFKEFDRGIAEGAKLIRAGDAVAFPTETVYGLGADALRSEAVSTIFAAKGRPGDNPLIVHVSQAETALKLAHVTRDAERLMEAFWPGPLTLVLKKRPCVPYEVTAGLPTVALRMPAHDGALALIEASGVPIAAPSANLSGKPSPTCAQHVIDDMDERIPLILDGGPCEVGLESTVLSLNGQPTILRPGVVTSEMIASVIGSVSIAESVLSPLRDGQSVLSPGMKYTHYAPLADVIVVDGEWDKLAKMAASIYDAEAARGNKCAILATEQTRVFYGDRSCVIMGDRENPVTICRALFALLREADEQGINTIIVEALPPTGLGLAFMNRALRAAGFRFIRA